MSRIVLDIDGVMAGFVEGANRLALDMTGKALASPALCWNWLTEGPGETLTPEENKALWDCIGKSDTFWVDLPELPHAGALVTAANRWLAKGHDVIFLTTRTRGVDIKAQTDVWLQQAGVDLPRTILIAGNKGEVLAALKADVFVDDYAPNILDACAKSPNTNCILLAQPWNADATEEIDRAGALRLGPEATTWAIDTFLGTGKGWRDV